jgi:hypothetical protein
MEESFLLIGKKYEISTVFLLVAIYGIALALMPRTYHLMPTSVSLLALLICTWQQSKCRITVREGIRQDQIG